MSSLKYRLAILFHPKLKSDNANETMRLVRILAHPVVFLPLLLLFIGVLFLCFNIVVNGISYIPRLSAVFSGQVAQPQFAEMVRIHEFTDATFGRIVYGAAGFFFLILFIKLAYKIRISYTEKDINKGTEGTSRFTTLEEIDKQFKAIPLYPSVLNPDGSRKTNYYAGLPGNIVSRFRDRLYIDTQLTNNLYLGTTRSGKGELYVFSTIDHCSRAKEVKDRPSMVIFDPKLELYKSSKKTLEKRGYKVRLVNLDDPNKSAGFDPLYIAVQHYKAGNIEKAQQAAKTFSFGIFNSDQDVGGGEPIWKNTATDLFTALIIANITDCLEADELLNMQRRIQLRTKKENYAELDAEEKALADAVWEKASEKNPEADLISTPQITCIPDSVSFFEIHPNEKNINCYSVINFFKDLCDRASLTAEKQGSGMEKEADSLLEDYFNSRPALDFAKSLYATIKSSKERTKGSIYVNMQSAVSIFSLSNIAKLTAENDIDFAELGYGEQPVAVFLGIPSEDRSNYFLATTFVSQVYQYLFQLTKASNGRLKRNVRFIIDEFGNMPVIENFASFVTVGLGAGISFDLFVQSYMQIETKYGKDTDTIKENCANRIYILNGGNESTEEFSEMLGNKTIIEVQRTGGRFSTDKTYMENPKERPLMYPQELRNLLEGETVMCRISKRSDITGAAVKPHPVLNEYLETLPFFVKASLFRKTAVKRFKEGKAVISDTGKAQSFSQEYNKAASDAKKWLGTSLLYRYQYMSEDFPNPNDINFDDICNESRAHIDFTKRINDPEKTARRLRLRYMKTGKIEERTGRRTLASSRFFPRFFNQMAETFADDFMEALGLRFDMPISEAVQKLRAAEEISDIYFEDRFKNEMIMLLERAA